MSGPEREIRWEAGSDHRVGRFWAMGCPCEILIAGSDQATAREAGEKAAGEVWRIQDKFSRFRSDSVIGRINAQAGEASRVDQETAELLDFADTCYRLSDGRFDVTAEPLQRAWRFDRSDGIPAQADIEAARARVGWHRVAWNRPWLRLAPFQTLDLGGLGKEYAVDRAAALITHLSAIVNLGGDLVVTRPRPGDIPWMVGIDEQPDCSIRIAHGAIATSGETNRYRILNGRRFGHIVDPQTGWPIPDAPAAITVVGPTALQAGMFATLAMLQGAQAGELLAREGVPAIVEGEWIAAQGADGVNGEGG